MKKMMMIGLVAAIVAGGATVLSIAACDSGKVTAHAYEALQEVTAVDIDVDRANITLIATDGETKVEYEEAEKIQFRVVETGGVLRITEKDLPFYKEMFQGTDVMDIVVYAPKTLTYLSAER